MTNYKSHPELVSGSHMERMLYSVSEMPKQVRHDIRLKYLIILLGVLFFSTGLTHVAAAQKPDTSGVTFTTIPTAADSIAAQKKLTRPTAIKAAGATVVKAKEVPKTLWTVFIEGLLGGFLALLMPCIYPMIPLTVSFFTKRGGTKVNAIFQSLIYGLSIIVIYVALGFIITLLFGSDGLNALATNGIFNFFFFLLLVTFGASFLGAFEIQLPASLANKLDQNSDKGGLAGIFFMAATLAVVSFSCTGPIIGSLLVEAATKGERLGPAVGMLGFSAALAIPFALFALFPSLLSSLPKSGGWLNSVKVVLGFLELAFALKFLSNVDLAYHWNWFDREIFLSIWIAIGLLMGLYLIGKITFSHDSPVQGLSVTRTFIAIIVFAFTFYMIPGLWGAPLKAISGFLPPPATQDFYLTNNVGTSTPNTSSSNVPKKYEELFKRGKHAGLNEYYDYDQALQASRELKKPVMIDFTGWNCANCRKMENEIWSDNNVEQIMQNDYILLELYVDEKTALPDAEKYTSTFSGKKITDIGKKNSDYEASKFNVNSQPYYVIINAKGDVLVPPMGANFNVENYTKFLDSGKAAFQNNNGSN